MTDQPELIPPKKDVAVPGANDVSNLLHLAIEKDISVEALEKLAGLYERFEDRRAAQEFAEALSSFQDECPPIQRKREAKVASRKGGTFKYKFAPLEDIARIVNPLLRKRGLSYSWDATGDGRNQCVTCTLRHVNGHATTSSFSCPVESSAGMSEQQKHASALTYAKRQSLVMALGITHTEDDTDGAGDAEPDPITEGQAADLETLIENVGADREKFLIWLGVESVSAIPASAYGRAVRALEAKRK